MLARITGRYTVILLRIYAKWVGGCMYVCVCVYTLILLRSSAGLLLCEVVAAIMRFGMDMRCNNLFPYFHPEMRDNPFLVFQCCWVLECEKDLLAV